MKIYSIGFNYSLVTRKKFAICLLKMTLEHSVAYFQVVLALFQWWLLFFSNIRTQEYLARDLFHKGKNDLSRSEVG